MAKSCNLKFNLANAKAFTELKKYCGNNDTQFFNYLANVIHNIDDKGNIDFTEEFKKSWKGKEPLDINTSNPIVLRDRVIAFHKKSFPSSADFERESKSVDKVKKFGYTNTAAREEAKTRFVEYMIQGYHKNENEGLNRVKENLKAYYVQYAIKKLNGILAKRLSKITGIPANEIKKNFANNNAKYIKDILKGHESEVNLQLENLIAVYNEYSCTDLYEAFGLENTSGVPSPNPQMEFFTEIMKNKNLGQIRMDKADDLDEAINVNFEQEEKTETNGTEDTEYQTNDTDSDNTIGTLNNKMGEYVDFMTHVGAPIRALLGSLKIYTTTEDPQNPVALDTNNYLGIAGCMDANTCASVLYHYGEYDSIETMMNSIDKISKQVPGFAGFTKLYETLQKNPDLQYEFYRTFQKLVISKVETTIEDGQIKMRVSNSTNNKQIILYGKMLNAFKSSALNSSAENNVKIIGTLGAKIDSYNPAKDVDGKKIRELAETITETLNLYFPFIDNMSVRNFILMNEINGKVDPLTNIKVLRTEIENLINAASETTKNYFERQSRIFAAYRQNGREKAAARNEHRDVDSKKIIDMSTLYSEGYISKDADAICTRLSKLLEEFSLISTPLNSRDPYGHQSSDVINSSLITSIINTLQSKLNKFTTDAKGNKVWTPESPIMRLAQHKSQSTQYDFSNILIEHIDEKGNIINKGLFRKDKKGVWIPTDYATSLLSISFYNGASNRDTNENVNYANMSHGDYLSSAWKNFFNGENNETAGYFMRIPSDAPHICIVNAPRYSAADFLVATNMAKIDAEITSLFNEVSKKEATDLNLVTFSDKPIIVSDKSKVGNNTEAFISHIQATKDNPVDIKIPRKRQYRLKNDKKNTVRIALRYSMEDSSNNDNIYVMEGTYYDGVLHDAKFIGFKKDSINDDIWTKARKAIKDQKNRLSAKEGGIEWKVNTKHKLYQQLYNVFQQELMDMVVAGDVMFESIKDSKGNYTFTFDPKTHEPLLKNGMTNLEHNGLHPTYHFKEADDASGRKIFEVKDGKCKLLGNVFHSDRFILYDSELESDRNFGEEILQEAFSFFNAGKGKSNVTLSFKKDKNGNIILNISDVQKAKIEEKINEFVIKYIEEAREEMSDISNLDNPKNFTSENLAEFTINHHLTYIGFNDLFEGDSKFYKNTQTFLKRAKEVQGSGVPYGMADFTRPIQAQHVKISSPLDDVTFFGGKTVQMYDGFSAVTIYNTIHTDKPMLECLVRTLTDKTYMGDKVLTEDQARDLLYGPKDEDGKRDGGYQNTTVNDAQSYISFDEFIRRIAGRGQLQRYKPLIDRILDESQPLDLKDVEELVQVQKNFYYDQYYNTDTKVMSPRQIKNAEFVLIPRLVRGTELERIAKMMDKLGIDQLNTAETSKAGQGTRFVLWDETGNLTDEVREDLEHIDEDNYEWKSDIMKARNTPLMKEYYNYNYLYTQQETPQHLGIEAKNKAGIQIMKKITDNIDENSPQELRDAKEEFFKLYSTNIKSSYETLMNRLKVAMEDGKIKLVDGKIEGLDHKELFSMVEEELIRLGMDSNMQDYCTIDPTDPFGKRPIMPLSMSLIGPKAENIFQSLFNRNITRQTLPGFHAAQVTGVGFKTFEGLVNKGISSSKYSRTSNPLNYHFEVSEENGELVYREYAEIMLPPSAFGLDRNAPRYRGLSREEQNKLMLQDLKDAGLDEIIGYRIPTEGKQSIAYMKVVDFTDEAYGSTIIVPDAWVSQTGADFDIDSVYGIQYKAYITPDGRPKKIPYHNKDYFKNKGIKAWYDYVAKEIGGYITALSDEEFTDIKDKAKATAKKAIQDAKDSLTLSEQTAYNSLPKAAKNVIQQVHKMTHDLYGAKLTYEQYKDQLIAEIDNLENILIPAIKEGKIDSINKEDTGAIEAIKAYIAVDKAILNPEDNKDSYSSIKSEEIKKAVAKAQEDQRRAYEAIAESRGLLSADEYLKQATESPELFNSIDARTNGLIDCMKTMLTHPYSLEENLSRSNFEDVGKALAKANGQNKISAAKRKARSPYNIFSQARYQEDAMSGAKLKGISVVRDNLCSVMNTVKPIISQNATIKVFYNDSYDYKTLSERFDEFEGKGKERKIKTHNVQKVKGGYIVTHNRFGWSNDNKNIDGKILTSYSSQTTAHILDAMKYGNVPNVNELTFQVYKTFVDMGSNYDMAVSFITQPGITKIVNAYNNSNSIYSEEKSRDYVKQAIRAIADELNIEYEYSTTTEDILKEINSHYGPAVEALFGKDYKFTQNEEINANVVLNPQTQFDRLADVGIFEGDNSLPVEGIDIELDNDAILSTGELKSLYDLGIILQYDKISKLVGDIRSTAMVSNPDKFGAKQTIFATRKIFENIFDSIRDNITVDENGNPTTTFRLQKDGKNVIEAIYPGIHNEKMRDANDALNAVLNDDNFVANSKYPFLAAFLKYSTAPSIVINQTIFETQSEEFRKLISTLEEVLGNGHSLSEVSARQFQQYIVNYLALHRSRFLQAPLRYNMGTGRARGFEYGNYKPDEYNQDEANRVIGYGYPPNVAYIEEKIVDGKTVSEVVDFKVTDINGNNQEEVDRFAQLSPAQKIYWVQQHFSSAPLFNYIDVNLYNEYAIRSGNGYQTIEFNEDAADIETVYREFEKAYTNKNPFIALAAADIIKYAFYSEGYHIGMNNVSKMIVNSVLTNNDKLYGTGIVSDLRDSFADIDNILNGEYEHTKRSVGETLIENFIRSHSKSVGIGYHRVSYIKKKGYELNKTANKGLIYLNCTNEEGRNIAVKHGILYEDENGGYKSNYYVRLGFGKEERLYRVNDDVIGSERIVTLIPLNKLKSDENSTWSAIESNNEFWTPDYYNTLINNYFEAVARKNLSTAGYHAETMKDVAATLNKESKKYSSPKANKINEKLAKPIPNINTNPSFKTLIDAIKEWYPTSIQDGKPVLYLFNLPLGRYITHFGIDGQSTQDIILGENGVQRFNITKLYFGEKTKKNEITNTYIGNLIIKYTGSHMNSPISKQDEDMADLIHVLRTTAEHYENHTLPSYFSDIYAITPTDIEFADNGDENESFSTKLDIAVQAADSIDVRAKANPQDVMAAQMSNRYRELGVVHKTTKIEPHAEEIIINTAKYLEELSNTIENRIDNYYYDEETKSYLPINDPKTIKVIKKSPILVRQYFIDLLEPNRVIKQFGMIKDLDISSEDPSLEVYLTKIKKAIDKLQNMPKVKNAFEQMAKAYYDSATNNPIVKQGMLSVLDGYYQTNWANAMFNDIQETSNPIVQIAMKNFKQDLHSKQFQAKKEAREFVKHIEDIKKRAAAAGKSINMDNIIDEYGRFKKIYNDEFIRDRNRLMNAHNEAQRTYGRGSLEELKTRLEYNEWKAKHVHQPLKAKYYNTKNAILRKALYGETIEVNPVTHETEVQGAFPEYLSQYEQLVEKRRQLRNKWVPDVENPDLDRQIEELDGQINAMTYPFTEVGRKTGEEARNVELLKEYINANRSLERSAFKYSPVYNFDEVLKENLRKVASYETSGRPAFEYTNEPTYVKAKTWLRKNAHQVPIWGDEAEAEIEEAFDKIGREKALTHRRKVMNDDAYKGKDGRFDPRLVPADEIKRLKDEEVKYNGYFETVLSDRTLISNGNPNEEIYTEEFYKGMKGKSNRTKSDNPLWQKTVKRINELLSPYYDEYTKSVELNRIPNTPEGIKVLEELRKLYDTLDNIRGTRKGAIAKKFIKDNVDTKAYNKFKYDADVAWMKGLPYGKYRTAIRELLTNINFDDEAVPNQYLYGYIKPKDSVKDKFIDKEKTEAIKTLNKYYEVKTRPEFEQMRVDMYVNHPDQYEEWLTNNTVYNPYTHQVEPISIWRIRTKKADKFEWEPKFPQTIREPRDGTFTKTEYTHADDPGYEPVDDEGKPIVNEDGEPYFKEFDFRNKKYNPNGGHLANFKKDKAGTYESAATMNEYELEMSTYMQNVLDGYVHTKQGKQYLSQGYLPARAIGAPQDIKGWIKELFKTIGFTNEMYDPKDWYDEVDYSKDKPRIMPMLSLLKGKGYKTVPKKPTQDDKTDEAYQAELLAWEKDKAEIEKNNLEIHKKLHDKDYIGVIEDFIIQAGTYNAIQDNKFELFYARTLLENYGHYITSYTKTGKKHYKKKYSSSDEDQADYQRQKDKYLIEQFDNQIRRIVYDQFKAPNNPRLMKWMSMLQGITSAQYMMMNFKGGIANITLGESSIMQEVWAKEFFDKTAWLKSKTMYGSGILDYIQGSFGGAPNTLAGSVVNFMDVVDYDEHTGVSKFSATAYDALKKFRNFGYTPQTSGEHEMQNSAMFAMMYSHRLFEDPNRAEFGRPTLVFKNFAEFVRDERENSLLAILNDEEREAYDEYKKKVTKDEEAFRDFAHFKKDITHIFAQQYLSHEKQKEYIAKMEEKEKELEAEFNDDTKHPTIMSQLSKDEDGILSFVKGSKLAKLHEETNEDGVSKAYALLGEFKSRVISVNKYIHGVYDKSGRAQIEKTWIGSLLMQYHKHLPLGIMKRYRSQGYYNEERGTVQKGMYRSLYDYLSIPFKRDKELLGLNEEEVNALQSVQNVFKQIIDFALHFNTAYKLMPDYDKANIRRAISGSFTILATIAATIAIKAGWDDDDSILFNQAIYQADRLSTESSQYIPFVAWGEARKLWQSPIAAGSGVTDALSSANMIAHMIIDGDEYDGEYHSGKFAGESKLSVYIQRRIPIWRGIKSSFVDIKDNNKFYKVSENMLGFFNADDKAEELRRTLK